jgi:hypothetical protein
MLSRTACVVLLALFAAVAFAGSAQVQRVTGIYSNLYYNKEGGDLIGMELLILPSGHGPEPAYSVFVQIAEGGAPFSALVPLKVTGAQIEFTLPPGGTYDREHFIGTFKRAELVVRWSQGTEEHLKRGRSYWQ